MSTKGQIGQLLADEDGQDLIEYALVGLAAVAAMRGLATKISSAFTTVGINLTSNVSGNGSLLLSVEVCVGWRGRK